MSRSGFYDSRSRPPAARTIRQAWLLTDQITAVHEASRQTCGAPRVRAELVHGQGVVVSRKTVALLMRRAGLAGLPLRRRAKRVPAAVTVTDLVKREFRRDGPNQLWATDITEHPTREGKLYCCVVLDAYSRRVVGWAIDSRQRADLATSALGMAIDSRGTAGQVAAGIIHGDHGTQFTSWTVTERAERACSLPWGPLAIRTTMPSPRRSGRACRPSYSTGNAGAPASSSRTQSSSVTTTSRNACSTPEGPPKTVAVGAPDPGNLVHDARRRWLPCRDSRTTSAQTHVLARQPVSFTAPGVIPLPRL